MTRDWMSVAQAAARLQVSPRRVRQLLGAGELAGEDIGGRALLDAAQVERRAARRPPTGRPYSPALAWMLLTLLSDPKGTAVSGADRSTRHRLRRLLAQPSDPDGNGYDRWAALLRRRAYPHRYWAHPGLLGFCGTNSNSADPGKGSRRLTHRESSAMLHPCEIRT